MPQLATHRFKIRYTGGDADENQIPFYDGSTSINGICQALQITTHAYINDAVISRATALRGAKFYLRPAKSGSFLVEVVAFIEQYPASAAIAAPVFYDFIKLAWSKATGLLDTEPDTSSVRRLLDRDEPYFDELAETLEGSLQRAHRPIGEGVRGITLEQARKPLLNLTSETKDWVNTADELPQIETLEGNVTRFNSVTRNGRVYLDDLQRIVPFKPAPEFPPARFGYLTWSLHGSNTDLLSRLELDVKRVRAANGRTKRVILMDCRRLT